MARKGDRARRREDWGTDQRLFDKLNDTFKFDLDCAAMWYNAKCENYISPEQNALVTPWHGKCFLNHPYGSAKQDTLWMNRAYDQVHNGNADLVVSVTKASVGAYWWKKQVLDKANKIVFLTGRPVFQQYDDEGNELNSTTPMYDVCVALFCKRIYSNLFVTFWRKNHLSWWDWKNE
jgi:phage N-6-adenine-methyltransferase